jgi:hypothetical protein
MASKKKGSPPTPEQSGTTHARESGVKRDAKGRWLPGASACPGGPGPGYKWRQTRLAEQYLLEEAPSIVLKLIEMALSGNHHALRLATERLLPAARDRNVRLPRLPKATTAEGIAEAVSKIVAEMGSGELTPLEAQAAANVLELQRRSLELVEIERRLLELEEHARDAPRFPQ